MIKNKHIVALCFLTILPFVSGCITPYHTLGVEKRSWVLEYGEKLTVLTEPTGARIYVEDAMVKDVGVSPVETMLGPIEFSISEYGEYQVEFTAPPFSGVYTNKRRISATNWSGNLETEPANVIWIIRAFKDGYRPAETKIVFGKTKAFQRSVPSKLNPDGSLPSTVIGNNSILLVLQPVTEAVAPLSTQQQHKTFLPDMDKNEKENSDARREYEKALASYNQALKNLDNARTQQNILNLSNPESQKPGFMTGMGVLMKNIVSPAEVQSAERDVEIARQRLERAKARLDHSEW